MSRNLYCKPYPTGLNIRKRPAPYHKTQRQMTYAIDFAMPIGTPVLAAADGVVWAIRNRYRKNYRQSWWGANANFLIIKHSYGEYSQYLHLAPGSCQVKVGDKVEAGQTIALSGETGYATYPHLHFAVLKFDKKVRSILITFARAKHQRKGK